MPPGHPCAACGNDDGAFGFGFLPGAKVPPYWLCAACWRLTPHGQSQLLRAVADLNGDTEDDASLLADEALDGNEPGAG